MPRRSQPGWLETACEAGEQCRLGVRCDPGLRVLPDPREEGALFRGPGDKGSRPAAACSELGPVQHALTALIELFAAGATAKSAVTLSGTLTSRMVVT
jgi:hypothetical protein